MEIDIRDMPYMVRVTEVRPLPQHRLEVWFDDGNHGIYDMTPYLDWGVFTALRDEDLFNRVRISFGAPSWPGDLDVAPERIWTDCDPVGEDWRPRLLPRKYFD